MELPERASIIEVGPRDGLQNERNFVETAAKIEFIKKLKKAGFQEMELTSFVSPKWVPQMKDSEEILASCLDATRNFVLTPNERGIQRLLETSCRNTAVFVGVSDTFNQKNINKTTAESLDELKPLIRDLKNKGYFVRACISTAFYCPYEGKVDEQDVLAVCEKFEEFGVDELSVADTIGMATPKEVFELFSLLKHRLRSATLLTAHFHDTRGLGLANIFSALQAGVNRFDASAGGLGGCPFAPGASGNVATEDVLHMLSSMGIQTGIQMEPLLEAVDYISRHVAKPIESRQYRLARNAGIFS
ncbi:hydroxymethylglutaryl-CoA lyase [Fictibacillus iocasae]|uniref:Hydroxymethylglutaryl-CoA lyase n=1 Tax=Fictibacillus iocasae TaxID=2715437 RepID=A0ABW2NPC7_9BACL